MSQIAVKGDRDGLIIELPRGGDNDSAVGALRSHLEQAGAFFKNAVVTLDVGERAFSQDELSALRTLLREWDVRLEALRASNDSTRAATLALDLELPFVADPATNGATDALRLPDDSAEALLLRRTLRSGQAVRHPGAIIILGDVNPGAQVIAGGDVVVWGVLRGVVHAGAMGDDGAIVVALKLAPTQLRISDHITISPEEKPQPKEKVRRIWQRPQHGPEWARIQDGGIVVEPWPGAGK